ncbi:vomeronasal type-2 receptor 116-like [Dipodomys merriami]|uniref:vomeronasal type-2 receptor 116-like n=1 Tax=Dipodomys merriami TaxID=94247 RepID=UPI003855DF88
MDGDVMIAGFFPLYTLGTDRSNSDSSLDEAKKLFVFKYYQLVLALAFAVEEINKNSKFLHNMTLGFDVYNADLRGWSAFKNPFIWLSGHKTIPNYTCMAESKFVAVIAGTSGMTSAEIGTLLELYRFPQLTFGAFDPALSDHGKFHSLYQMSPKDTSLAIAMVSLLLHFSWNWVGLLISEDENVLRILAELREKIYKSRICIAFDHVIPGSSMTQVFNMMAIQNEINKSSANVLIIYDDTSLEWLPEQIFDMAMSEVSYNIYNAVYAVAHALHEMLLHQTEEATMGNGRWMVPSPAQMHPFLKNIQFHNLAGDQVILNEERKLEAEYDILNIWNFPEGLEIKMKIGKFSTYAPYGHQLSVSKDMIEWAIGATETPRSVCSESCAPGFRKSFQGGKAICCFDCTPCLNNEISNRTGMEGMATTTTAAAAAAAADMEQCMKCPDHQYANKKRTQCLPKAASFLAHDEPLGMGLVCMALCLSTFTALILGVFLKYQDIPIVKANNLALSFILLISLIFCFLCSLLFIGCPNIVTCILQQITFGVVFTVAVSTVLAKTVTVVLAFKATSPGRRMRWLLVSGAPNFIIPICTLIQVTLCGLWLGTSPPFVDTDAHSEYGHAIILCNKGSLTAVYCVLGYLVFLALTSFTVAYLARNLPDTFNEAKFLTFSMLVFCSVWVTFLPVYHSAKGKVMVAVEVFSILSSSAGLLGCIFVPKCYIILIRPERISLHGFKGKMHTGRNESS